MRNGGCSCSKGTLFGETRMRTSVGAEFDHIRSGECTAILGQWWHSMCALCALELYNQ